MSANSSDRRSGGFPGIYRAIRRLLARVPVLGGLLDWTNPLHLPNALLRRAIADRARFAGRSLLDVGCGTQPYRALFQTVERYVGMDLAPGDRVDVVGDGLALPFRDACFDTVMCNQVLEHVPEPGALLSEIARVLEPGGHLLLTTPQTWGLHLEPHDYYRYTPYGLRYQSEKNGLQVLDLAPTSGFWATFSSRLADTVVHNYGRDWARPVVVLISVLLAPALLAGAAMDRLFGIRGDALDNILVAVKPAGARRA